MTVASTTNKQSYNGNGTQSVFAYTFKIFVDADIKVYVGTTLKTINTHYTLSGVGTTSGGNVTFTAGNFPVAGTGNVTLLRSLALTQGVDLINYGKFDAEVVEAQYDKIVMMVQQLQEQSDRTIKFSTTVSDAGGVEITDTVAERSNKVLAYDNAGDLSVANELGEWKGNWATSTAFAARDLVLDTATNNVYICLVGHTSGTLSTDVTASKWALVINAAAVATSAATATTKASEASTSASTAQDWAEKTDGVVTGSSYSAKHWATTGTVATVSAAIANVNLTAGSIANVNTTAGSIANVNKVAAVDSNVTTVAGIDSNVTTVAGIASNVTTVAGKSAQITLLGTSDAVADMNTLGTADVVTDMNTLGTSDVVSDMNTLAAISANITTAAGIAANITTTAGISSNVSTVAGIAANITTNANNIAAIQGASAAATLASNSAAAAAASFDSFDDRYLGAKASEVSVNNDGDALVAGNLYFLTGTGMQVYDGANWIAASSSGNVSMYVYEYIATANQTTFSGADSNSQTLSYAAGNIIVSYGGYDLPKSDYTATNGTSVVLDDGAVVGEIVRIVAFQSFVVANTYTQSQADVLLAAKSPLASPSFTGTVTASTDLNVGGAVKGNAGTRAISVGTAGSVTGGLQLWAAPSATSYVQFGDEAGTAANHYRGYMSYAHSNDSMNLGTSGQNRMTLDSSGNVGIGVVPEAHHNTHSALQVGGNGVWTSYKPQGASGEMDFQHNAYYSQAHGGDRYISTDEATKYRQVSGAHQWYTAGSGSADAAISWRYGMQINNDGIVTKPLQPSFRAKGYASRPSGVVLFGSVPHNVGSHYNNSNGRFTAPIAGNYLMTWFANAKSATSYMNWALHINGNEAVGAYSDVATASYDTTGGAIVVSLAAGDYVNVYSITAYPAPSTTANYSFFSGYLLG